MKNFEVVESNEKQFTLHPLNLHRDAAKWIINVTDQGYGIAESDMSKLFSRFTRLKHDAQPEEDGIGLGLVFVKTVVERHHGSIKVSIKVSSKVGVGSGTTFAVTLPAAEIPAE